MNAELLSHWQRRECPKQRGFTLIELLVVIAVIALLAAILFPVFARARENARRSSCSSNLKQIGLGLLQYAQDYDEKYPVHPDTFTYGNVLAYSSAPGNWIYGVQPYLKSWQLFRCPSAVDYTGGAGHNPSGNDANSYWVNGVVTGRAVSVVTATAGTIWAHEAEYVWALAAARPSAVPATSPQQYQAWLCNGYDTVHFNGGNFLFCDGHVKWRKQSSVKASDFGLVATPSDLVGEQPASTTATASF